jgi:hypothetical protein
MEDRKLRLAETGKTTMWQVKLHTSQNTLMSNFIQKKKLFFENYDSWMRIQYAWIMDNSNLFSTLDITT